jgi:O-antigen/teichoic acid export membrane protein
VAKLTLSLKVYIFPEIFTNMKKQIVKNITMNGFSFFCNVVIGLLLTPYLVKHIGVAAYGLIPLAMFFTEYIGVITQSLTASINRSLTLALQDNNLLEANKVFNSALFLMLFIATFQLICIYYPIKNITTIISIPALLSEQAVWFFAMIFINFSVSLIASIFSVSMYAANRLDLMEIANILRALTRVGIILLLFSIGEVDLISVGIASILSGLVVLLFAIYWWVKLTPSLTINPRVIAKEKLKPIFSLGGWLLVNQVGFLLLLKVDLLIINKFMGAVASGEYSVATKLSEVLRALSAVLSGVLGPVVMIYFAKQEFDKMIGITVVFIKFLSLLMTIPIVVVCVFSQEILSAWMGEEFEHLYVVVWLVTLPLVINLGITPLFAINVALNKVKAPALVTLMLGVVGVISSILLIQYTNLGYLAIAASSGIILTIKNAIFIPLYGAKILNLPIFTFTKIHVKTMLFLILILISMSVVKSFFEFKSLVSLFSAMSISAITSIGILWFFYSIAEIKTLKSILSKKTKK